MSAPTHCGGTLEAQDGQAITTRPVETRTAPSKAGSRYWHAPLAVFLTALATGAAFGSVLYLSARRSVLDNADLNLLTVARLKADQVSHWLEEVAENIEIEARRDDVAAAIGRWRNARAGDAASRDALLGILAHLCAAPQAMECSLHAPDDGQLWITNGFGSDSASVRAQALAAALQPEPQLEEMHIQHHSNPASLETGYFYGIRNTTGPPVAVLHVTVDPSGMFRLAAEGWPGLNRSFETVLLRADGTRLSEPAPARIPQSGQPARSPANGPPVAVLAARGTEALLSGPDEQGVPVLAHAFPVFQSPWFVMTKIGRSEVFSELNTFATLAAATLSVMLLTVCLAWSERRRLAFSRERDHHEKSMLVRRIDYLARYANDCILLSDPDGRILEANERCELTYGYGPAEMSRMHLADLLPVAARADWQMLLARLQTHRSVVCEAEHQRKDGGSFPVEISACLISAEGDCFLQAIVRDVSDRRNAEVERAGHLSRHRDLSRRLISIQERERRRISADLHDGAVANLAAVKMNLSAIAKAIPDPTGLGTSLMDETKQVLVGTIEQIRHLCSELHPSVLEQGGLVAALESRARELRRRTGMEVRVHYDDLEQRLSPEVEAMFYRIAQEAMRNCEKHSKARLVEVRLARSAAQIELSIADDGRGFDADRQDRFESERELGLPTMRERAEFMGAQFEIESRPGQGTTIRVRLDPDRAFPSDV